MVRRAAPALSKRERWYIYVVRAADGSLYTGIARDIGKRLAEHRSGKGSRYLRGRGPLKIVYREKRDGRSSALKREAFIKHLDKTSKMNLIKKAKSVVLAVLPFVLSAVAVCAQAAEAPSSYFTADMGEFRGSPGKIFIIQDPQPDVSQREKAVLDIQTLLKKERISLVLVPGASGDVSLFYFRQRASNEKRRQAAGLLFSKGQLTTAEFLDLSSKKQLLVHGVEEEDLYTPGMRMASDLLRHFGMFDHLRGSKNIPASLHRILDMEATPEDLDDYGSEAPYGAYMDMLVEFQKNSSSRTRFMAENIRKTLEKTHAKKAVLLMPGAQNGDLKKELKENSISYEELSLRNEAKPDEEKIEERLFRDAGSLRPFPYRRNAWKTLFLKRSFLARRPAREALTFELLGDRKPNLWDLGEALGFSPEERMQAILNAWTPSSAEAFKKFGNSEVHFSWAKGLAQLPSAEGPGGQALLAEIDKDFDKQKYMAFKELMNRAEQSNVTADADEKASFALQCMANYENALLEADKVHQEKKRSLFKIPWLARLGARVYDLLKGIPSEFKVVPAENAKVLAFLRGNKTETGLPLSYKASKEFWLSLDTPMDEVDAVMERLLVTHSVSIYDAALWQISLTLGGDAGDGKLADDYTERLLSGRSGDLAEIRASAPIFRYGDDKNIIPSENAYFFRLIADMYIQKDPLGKELVESFPNFPQPHHEDWKPITGEQAWATIIGPLQRAYLVNGGKVPQDGQELKLAMSILPALESMRAANGAFYHAPEGTYGKNPNDISNENNFSMYAALGILKEVLEKTNPEKAAQLAVWRQAQLNYFKHSGFDFHHEVFYQGGIFLKGVFSPSKLFAVDCQTWAINSLGPKWIDATFGYGAAYRVWKHTKERAGYFSPNGALDGIGFSDGHDLLSVEWTCGAILSVRLLADYYKKTEPAWAEELKRDAVTMRYGIEPFKETGSDGTVAYLYANKRFFIPWGWWANPISSAASSAWVLLVDKNFDPFILGGGPFFKEKT